MRMMEDEEIREAIRREAIDRKVTCRIMLELAEWQGVSPKKIGKLCDEMKIKITACQLGCFK